MQLMLKVPMCGRAGRTLLNLEVALERAKLTVLALEQELDGYDHRAQFEKCKACLAILYYDASYSSRSEHVNALLDDPEVQQWIRESQE